MNDESIRIRRLAEFIYNRTCIKEKYSIEEYADSLALEINLFRNHDSRKRASLSSYKREVEIVKKLCSDMKTYFDNSIQCDDEAKQLIKIKIGYILNQKMDMNQFVEFLDDVIKGVDFSYNYKKDNKILKSTGRPSGINKKLHGNYDPQKESKIFGMIIREIMGIKGSFSTETATEIHAEFINADLDGYRFDELSENSVRTLVDGIRKARKS